MKTKLALWQIVVIIAVVAVVCLGIAAGIFWGKLFKAWGTDTASASMSDIDQVATANMAGITQIEVKTTSESVKFVVTEDKELKAELTGRVAKQELKNAPKLVVSGTGNIVKVEVKDVKTFHFFNFDWGLFMPLKLTVYLPKTYNGGLGVTLSSGSVDIGGMTLESLKLDLTSGDAELKDMNLGELNFFSTSGRFSCENVVAKKGTVSLTSGDAHLTGWEGALLLDLTSGDAIVKLSKLTGDVVISSTSGEVRVTLPADSSFKLDTKALSGDVKVDFPVTISEKQHYGAVSGIVGQNPSFSLTVKATSGDIDIGKN